MRTAVLLRACTVCAIIVSGTVRLLFPVAQVMPNLPPRLIDQDLTLFHALATTLQRLPFLRGAPLAEIAAQLSDAIRQQLDFAAEADALRLLRTNLAGLRITVPAVAW